MSERLDVIFFMSGGAWGLILMKIAKAILRRVRGREVVIDSIALMAPSEGDAMEELAAGTGGVLILVDARG